MPLPLPGAGKPLAYQTSVPGIHVVSTAQNTTGTLNVEGSLAMANEAMAQIIGGTK